MDQIRTPTPAAPANFASDWSGDGKAAVSVRIDRANRLDVWYQFLPNGPEQRLPFNTRFIESQAKVSPDNQWIAFVTDRAGKDDVWVADFPSGEHARKVSSNGGSFPTANVYVVTDDGQRFLIAERTSDPDMPPIKIVVNWWPSRPQ